MLLLMARAALGFVFLMLVLALALFLPAGSIRYWQAWTYLGVFGLCTTSITVYLVKNDPTLLAGRVQAGPVAEGERIQRIIQSLASLFFLGLFVVPGFDHRYGWSGLAPLASVIGHAVVALGFYVVFRTFRENSYASATIQVTPGQRLITSGPYSSVRHPMYAGGALLVIATPVALGSWFGLPVAVALILVIVVRLREEEKLLSASLSSYAEYARRVPHRLVPYIW